jgi:hypothetical protein
MRGIALMVAVGYDSVELSCFLLDRYKYSSCRYLFVSWYGECRCSRTICWKKSRLAEFRSVRFVVRNRDGSHKFVSETCLLFVLFSDISSPYVGLPRRGWVSWAVERMSSWFGVCFSKDRGAIEKQRLVLCSPRSGDVTRQLFGRFLSLVVSQMVLLLMSSWLPCFAQGGA